MMSKTAFFRAIAFAVILLAPHKPTEAAQRKVTTSTAPHNHRTKAAKYHDVSAEGRSKALHSSAQSPIVAPVLHRSLKEDGGPKGGHNDPKKGKSKKGPPNEGKWTSKFSGGQLRSGPAKSSAVSQFGADASGRGGFVGISLVTIASGLALYFTGA